MPTYLVLIHGSSSEWDAMTADEEALSAAGHEAFQRAAGDRVRGGHEVDRSAGVVSVRQGEPADGPLEPTDRTLGGYYVLEAADREEAVALVSHLRETEVGHSGVEVRQLLRG